LRDPNIDFGFKTMDPEGLAEMSEEFKRLAVSQHDSVHNPAERSVSLHEVEAKASASVAIGMSLALLEPDSYVRYWQSFADDGLPIPDAIQEQLRN
jgi:hypothetical protein